jgi:hypothetical protein
MDNHFFKYKDNVEGKVTIGQLPENLKNIINEISEEYYNEIPDKSASTYHTWYRDMKPGIKEKVKLVQNDPFWANLCDGSRKCIRNNVNEMDELYYSNVPSNTTSINLYGAATNYDIHRDCIYNFNGIKFYRILVGLTNGNENITTYFNNLDVGHKINKGDFIVFDFDNTTHQVIKENNKDTPRILLKIHYIVCENCQYTHSYVNFIKNLYINYEYVTRYVMKTGTDPETFYEFFCGLLCQYSSHQHINGILLVLTIILVIIFKVIFKINMGLKNISKVLYLLFICFLSIFLFLVIFHWLRYLIFNIK